MEKSRHRRDSEKLKLPARYFRRRHLEPKMRMLVVVLVLMTLAGGAGGWYWHMIGTTSHTYRTAKVQRGDVVSTISSTGTLEPEEVIDVGAQVAGLIVSFGKDSTGTQVDYRSPVEAGMVLASIDDTVYKADLDTAKAQLEQAKTNVLKGNADLAQANAKLVQADHNWARAKAMGPSDALSQNDYEMYQADFETARANVSLAEVEIAQANTSISLANAALTKAQRNVDFCTIKSPVNGVVIDRRVNIGQTVVSSLNAPSLFLLAKDLTRMQIWVAVNEADIGRIKPGAPVRFLCDTFPDQVFVGKVGKIRLNAAVSQNVVMYTVEVQADNPQKLLLPYLTAKVQFEVERENDALNVPNAALRWSPTSISQVTPAARATWKASDTPPAGANIGWHDAQTTPRHDLGEGRRLRPAGRGEARHHRRGEHRGRCRRRRGWRLSPR
jgi:HlyD family secretion protein